MGEAVFQQFSYWQIDQSSHPDEAGFQVSGNMRFILDRSSICVDLVLR